MPRVDDIVPKNYSALFEEIKSRIHTAQIKAAISVNRELIKLYWHIGESIVERQRKEGWGKSVVERLSQDIQKAFPGIAGFSSQNLWYMRAFYSAWTEAISNLQQPVGENCFQSLKIQPSDYGMPVW